jgi:DNA mismatch endonuclease vsr
MADIKSPEERSRNMRAIRSKDTKPEVYLRKLLFAQGLRYRKNVSQFPGHLICISQSTGLQFLFMGVSGIDTRAANTLTCRKAGLNSGRRNL